MTLPPTITRSIHLNFSVSPIPHQDRRAAIGFSDTESDLEDDLLPRPIAHAEGDQKWAWRLDIITDKTGAKACLETSEKALQWDSPEEALENGLIFFDNDVTNVVDLITQEGKNIMTEVDGIEFFLYSLGYFNRTLYSWKIDYLDGDNWMMLECSNLGHFWPSRADAVKRAREVFDANKGALVAEAQKRKRAAAERTPQEGTASSGPDKGETFSLWQSEDIWF